MINTDFQTKVNNIFSYLTIKEGDVDKDFCKKALFKIELRSYQRFVADYLKKYDHIRGLLVIHGLGSGKTLTSINTINSFPDKDVVIILPASLKGEWNKALKNTKSKINYISYNAPNIMDQYYNLNEIKIKKNYLQKNNFDNKLVIIEESHIFFQNTISSNAQQAIKLYNKLYESKNSIFLLLTATPISGDPFELVPVFNLLRKTKSGVPLFPVAYEKFHNYFVSTSGNSLINKEILQDRITGLVSYYKGLKDPNRYVIPEYLGTKIINCEMDNNQWTQYLKVRYEEIDSEAKNKINRNNIMKQLYKKPGKESSGTYKVLSSQSCNFTFPEYVEKKYKSIKGDNKIKNPTEIKWSILKNKEKDIVKYIADNINDLSSKANILIKNIINKKNKKIFIFSRFKILGVRIIGLLLQANGYIQIKEQEIDEENNVYIKQKAFIIIDGDSKDKQKMINFYNQEINNRGDYCQIIIGTSVLAAGVNLKDIREEHIYEPQWRYNTLDQIKGRGIRTCSHSSLPIEDRDVKVFLYLSTPKNRKMLLQDKGLSTDEFLYEMAKDKAELNSSFVNALKEAAVDCKFNLVHNSDVELCRYCINDPPVILFPDDIKRHIIEGSRCLIKEKKVNLVNFKYNGVMYKKDNDGTLYLWSEDYKGYKEVGNYNENNKVANLEGEGFDLF